MEQSELLRFVVSVLERLDIPYFVTGSTVTIFYGEPRFTNDIDTAYIDRWAATLGLAEIWQAILDKMRER